MIKTNWAVLVRATGLTFMKLFDPPEMFGILEVECLLLNQKNMYAKIYGECNGSTLRIVNCYSLS